MVVHAIILSYTKDNVNILSKVLARKSKPPIFGSPTPHQKSRVQRKAGACGWWESGIHVPTIDILKKDGRLFAITIGMIGEDSNTIKTSVQKHLKSFDTKIHYVSETPIDEYCKAKVDLMVRGGKVKNFDETFACFKEHYKKYDKVRGVIVDAKNTGETKISTIGE